MNMWEEFTGYIYRLSFFLYHQWTVALDDDTARRLLGETPPSNSEHLNKVIGEIDAWTRENSSPGAAGWGVTAPTLYFVDGGGIRWQHTSQHGRYRADGFFHHVKGWEIVVEVCRPYPWQPVVARATRGRVVGREVEPYHRWEWFPPVGDRHWRAAIIVAEALSVPMANTELLTNDALVEADCQNLRQWYSKYE
ncbi:MAG: hypothetical protein KatS3mg023_3923 [Armatimonadota bacterium]|nr:MAG: hypothetical protein KatS3mg023_3923 [Armatimonadota bacterium]